MERKENDRTAKRVYVREWAGSPSLGRLRKRWTDTVKKCLRKRGLDVRQARRMIQDKSERQESVRGDAWVVARGMSTRPLRDATVVNCPSYMQSLKGGSLSVT